MSAAVFWLSWPVLFLYLRWSERTRVLVVASDENILLVNGFLGDGRWGLPGGGLHKGESRVAGARRELREETGLDLTPQQLTPLASTVFRERGLRFICHYFLVELPEIQPIRRRFPEVMAVQWIPYRTIDPGTVGQDVTQALQAWQSARNLVQ